ncbi:MAG: septum formation inhibitor Maf [Burkholderiales bacterium]|nr:septum formation inhibitor Maf [Burkholderiales bacterium]
MADLYLASRSPRRRELLKQIGVRFEPLITRLAAPRGPDVDEAIRAGEAPADYVERIAREKAQFGIEALAMRSMLAKPVLSADTVVILDRVILGKPEDAEEATDFLRRLSGRVHEVRTSVAIAVPVAQRIQLLQTTSVSTVRFRALSAPEIDRYVASGDPMDKAGAYGIQGYAGIFVERLEGSYTGVMGLPLHETAVLLRQAGLRV